MDIWLHLLIPHPHYVSLSPSELTKSFCSLGIFCALFFLSSVGFSTFHSSLFRICVQPMWTKNKNIGLYFHLFVHIVFKLKLIWLRLSLCTISCTHMCKMAVCCSILFRVQFSIWLAIFWRHQNCWCVCVLMYFSHFHFLVKTKMKDN